MNKRRFRSKDIARQTALGILNRRDQTQKPLDTLMDEMIDDRQPLSRLDRRFVNQLVFGVLRWRNRLDWILGHFSHTALEKIDPQVRNVLRLGLYQVIYLDRVPLSAAVNTSVELSKALADPWVVKFANAVLRKAAAEYRQVAAPDPRTDPIGFIAVDRAFPKWLAERWLNRFGLTQTLELCDAVNRTPPITVRANSLKVDRESLRTALLVEARSVRATPYSDLGVSFTHPKLPLSKLATYQRGWFQVQDEAAQLVTTLLDPKPGESLLDACAGLGGKTGHLAQRMQNRGRIVAQDRDKSKLVRLRSEMMHLGYTIVTTNAGDLEQPAGAPSTRRFDRILLDAPCSGLGVLRRNPDVKWSEAKKDLSRFADRQLRLLDNLAPLLKTNGILLYAVCSMEPEENEAPVLRFLKRHPNFTLDKKAALRSRHAAVFIDPRDGFFRSFPHRHGTDGFFAARLKRLK